MKHWKLDIIGYWELDQVAKLKRAWNLAAVLQIVQKILEKYCPCLYLWIDQVWFVNELWFKRYIQKCALSHGLTLIICGRSGYRYRFLPEVTFNETLIKNQQPHNQTENNETAGAEYTNENDWKDKEPNKTSAIPYSMPKIFPYDEIT